ESICKLILVMVMVANVKYLKSCPVVALSRHKSGRSLSYAILCVLVKVTVYKNRIDMILPKRFDKGCGNGYG
ncbi:hypothetical protein STEG23_028781, partial [Scotinomys teguina]